MEYQIPVSLEDYTKRYIDTNIKTHDYGKHKFNFVFDNISYDYAVLKFKRFDGEVIVYNLESNDFVLSGAEIDVAGYVSAEISCYDREGRITTNTFEFVVYADIDTDNSIENNPKMPILDRLFEDVKAAESERILAETSRINSETDRTDAETDRKESESKRKEAESFRESAEELRESSEYTRQENETYRIDAEKERVIAESDRGKAEDVRNSKEEERQTNESTRQSAESTRITAESQRDSEEVKRNSAEENRASAEALRITAENERLENESERISAENARETRFSEISEQFGSLITKSEALKLLCIKGSVKSESGTVTLSDHLTNEKVIDYKIYGNSIQDGTPTLDNPIDIQSVGDLVTDTESEHYGKYKIPIIVRGENESDINYIEYIYLDKPLRKVGDSYDYVDFKNKKVVRNIKQEILSTTLPRFNFSSSWDNELLTTFYYKPEDIDATAGVNTPILCNYFKHILIYGANATEVGVTANTNGYIYCKIPKAIATNKTEFNTWLNSLGENVELYYSLTEPTEESIELPELTTTNSEIMNVVIDTEILPSSIEMTYYQDITTVINNKFNELQNAIIEIGGNE